MKTYYLVQIVIASYCACLLQNVV